MAKRGNLAKFIGDGAAKIADSLKTNCALIISQNEEINSLFDIEIFREENGVLTKKYYTADVSKMPPNSINRIRMVIIEMVDEGILHEGDYIFCIVDKDVGIEFDSMFFIFKIDENFTKFSKRKLKREIHSDVFDRVMEIAKELAREGREGRHVGTAFIIGDSENVLKKSRQLILNPFEGHSPDERNILDPRIKETIKNFAQLDGVFVIDKTGYIHAAGRYLNVDTSSVDLPGLGARHHSACAITKETNAIAIVLSESGGVIRVFNDGILVMEEMPN